MSAVTCRRAASSFDFVCFFFQKIILFYLHTCPAPQKSSVLLQSFVCFFKRNLKRRNWNEQIYVRLWQLFLKFEAFWTFFFWIISPADYFCFPFGQNPERELWCVSSFEKKKEQSKEMCELKAQNATLWLSLISVCNISSSIFCFVRCASKKQWQLYINNNN